MQTVVLPEAPAEAPASQPGREVPADVMDILVVMETDRHTLVMKQGSRKRHLRFTRPVLVSRLRGFCHDQWAWDLADMEFVVDGRRFGADQTRSVLLVPEAKVVDFVTRCRPSTLEFVRFAPSKG